MSANSSCCFTFSKSHQTLIKLKQVALIAVAGVFSPGRPPASRLWHYASPFATQTSLRLPQACAYRSMYRSDHVLGQCSVHASVSKLHSNPEGFYSCPDFDDWSSSGSRKLTTRIDSSSNAHCTWHRVSSNGSTGLTGFECVKGQVVIGCIGFSYVSWQLVDFCRVEVTWQLNARPEERSLVLLNVLITSPTMLVVTPSQQLTGKAYWHSLLTRVGPGDASNQK